MVSYMFKCWHVYIFVILHNDNQDVLFDDVLPRRDMYYCI